jgi:hypothetical protein
LGSNCFRVLTLVQNLGKGGAVRRGVLVARGRRILFADADGATTFSELDKLMKALPGTFIVFLNRNRNEKYGIEYNMCNTCYAIPTVVAFFSYVIEEFAFNTFRFKRPGP